MKKQEKKQQLKDQDCGLNIKDLSKSVDQNMSSLRMLTVCEVMGLDLSSKISGKLGMTQNGQLLVPNGSVLDTEERGVGLWPTPVRSDYMDVLGKNDTYKLTRNGTIRRYTQKGKNASLSLGRHVKFFPKGSLIVSEVPNPVSGSLNPNWTEWLMGYPQNWTKIEEEKE